jgi:outer membrane protein assembly factor BamE (lipoprotein component of BamABCDE complex)
MHNIDRCYEVLGLERDASIEEVKQAHRDLVRVWHPDRFAHDPQLQQKVQEKLKEINEAYERLQFLYRSHVARASRLGTQSRARRELEENGYGESRATPESPAEVSLPDQTTDGSAGMRWAAVVLVLLFVRVLSSQISVPSKTTAPEESPLVASSPSPTISPADKSVPSQIEGKDPIQEQSSPVTESEENGYQERGEQAEPRASWQPILPSGYFGIGSTKDGVLAIQGEPFLIIRNTWYYKDSSIDFSGDQVSGYSNISKNLKVRFLPNGDESEATSRSYFTIGSTKDEALAVQGTPSSVIGNAWYYKDSSIDFSGDQVSGYSNISKNLKVRFLPNGDESEATSRSYFTIGSTKDEVLVVQGTPSGVIRNTWYYKDSSIDFSGDQVSGYFNISKNLKVQMKHRLTPEDELKALDKTQAGESEPEARTEQLRGGSSPQLSLD